MALISSKITQIKEDEEMTLPMFLGLLSAFSVLTSMLMEAAKKWLASLHRDYAPNIVVLMIAFVVGVGGTAIFYVFVSVPFTGINVMCMILMGFDVWLVAMLGYDKVVQLIKQFAQLGG